MTVTGWSLCLCTPSSAPLALHIDCIPLSSFIIGTLSSALSHRIAPSILLSRWLLESPQSCVSINVSKVLRQTRAASSLQIKVYLGLHTNKRRSSSNDKSYSRVRQLIHSRDSSCLHDVGPGMPLDTQIAANTLVTDHGADPDDIVYESCMHGLGDDGWVDEESGDEGLESGFEPSHEGGEYGDSVREVFTHVLSSRWVDTVLSFIVTHVCVRRPGVSRSNIRSRRQRLDALRENWAEQIEELKVAYLEWKHKSQKARSSTSAPCSTSESSQAASDIPLSAGDDTSQPQPSLRADTHTFEVTAIWTHSRFSVFWCDLFLMCSSCSQPVWSSSPSRSKRASWQMLRCFAKASLAVRLLILLSLSASTP